MPAWTEAGAIREWARAQGYEMSDSGRLPARMRNLWMQAGSPYPAYAAPSMRQRARGYKSASSVPVNPPDPTARFVPTADPSRPADRGNDLRDATTEREARAREILDAAGAFAAAVESELVDGVPADRPVFTVDLVSGLQATVLTEDEVTWFVASRGRYTTEHRFTENTDMQDLDRLLQMELLQHRWNQWVLRGTDYDGRQIDDMEIAKKIREQNTAISALKDSMGLSKRARDANAAGVAERWSDLLARAKAFGYHREEQLRTALLLMNRLSSIVGQFDRSDDDERSKLGFTDEAAIIAWVRDEMIPTYHEVDAHFSSNTQRMWQRT